MKLNLAFLFAILLASAFAFHTSPDTKYDWENHESGDDLAITLRNEPGVIFVILFNKNIADNEELSDANDVLRNRLQNDLASHNEVTYTEVDLSDVADASDEAAVARLATYQNLAKSMKIATELLDEGPIVVVTNRGEGSWVHGKGKIVASDPKWHAGDDVFEEVLDSIEMFINESKDRKTGGTGVLPGSNRVRRGGEIRLGGPVTSY